MLTRRQMLGGIAGIIAARQAPALLIGARGIATAPKSGGGDRQKMFVMCGAKGEVLTSYDGIEWNSYTHGTASKTGACSNDDIYVCNNGGSVSATTDFSSWTDVTIPSMNSFGSYPNQIKLCDGKFVTMSQKMISYSYDGLNWTTAYETDYKYGKAFAYGNGTYLRIGGTTGATATTDSTSATTSTDLSNWSSVSVIFDNSYGVGIYVEYFNGRFIILTYKGYVLSSEDLQTWNSVNVGTTRTLKDICYGNGVYVVIGSSAVPIYYSYDLSTWNASNVTPSAVMNCVRFNDGVFVACGNSGTIYRSVDGMNWTQITGVTSNSMQKIAVY